MNAVAHRNHIRQTKASRIFDVCNTIFMLLLVAVTLYPFWYVAIISLSDGKAVLAGKVVLWPVDFTLESYKLALSDASIVSGFKNTLIYTTSGTFVNLAMSMLCAYPLSRPKFIGKGVVMKMIVFTMFFSGGMIPTYLVVNQLNMIDTIWAMILPGAISTYNMIVIRTFFMSIPESLNESASLDGANDLQILLRIVIPCSLPIIATMLLFYAVGHWNSYMNALLYLNKKALQPLQSILRNMVVDGQLTGSTTDVGGGSSFAVIETTLKYSVIIISTLPILLIYPFVQKYFVKGVMIGSVKG
ncbi:MAG TPA: carbohydrate ABC transporter permease [Candidatus Alectryocaccomicrobium excrementavium]|uniref:Carbohydrate ABC transporter permease n=1 Tax=Candidatus Alectryocaccomicrobium excrementavium TaxID=2840668 RepID=A0A9D1G2S3_9FIRM|nr:carbohydrate ABC transporter permease [Candidatus Alectryocaccomicrobium excrementavium]